MRCVGIIVFIVLLNMAVRGYHYSLKRVYGMFIYQHSMFVVQGKLVFEWKWMFYMWEFPCVILACHFQGS